jgi:hypothetical protein
MNWNNCLLVVFQNCTLNIGFGQHIDTLRFHLIGSPLAQILREDSAYVTAIEVAEPRYVLLGIFEGTAQGLEKIFVYHLTRK